MEQYLELVTKALQATGLNLEVVLDDESIVVGGYLSITKSEADPQHPFIVETAKTINNYPHEPDDVEIQHVDACKTIADAVCLIAGQYTTDRIMDFFEVELLVLSLKE